MDIVLIAGLWLDGSAWDDVLPELEALGHRGIPVTLPGQGDGTTSATYDDQAAAVLAAVDAAEGRPFVVGHSAASTLAWVAADQRSDGVTGVALIGGFPTTEATFSGRASAASQASVQAAECPTTTTGPGAASTAATTAATWSPRVADDEPSPWPGSVSGIGRWPSSSSAGETSSQADPSSQSPAISSVSMSVLRVMRPR